VTYSAAEYAALHDARPVRIDQRITVELVLDLTAELAEGEGRDEIEAAVETALRLWIERHRSTALSTCRSSIRLRVVDARMPAEGLEDLEMEEI
jgi:hypothetical protein